MTKKLETIQIRGLETGPFTVRHPAAHPQFGCHECDTNLPALLLRQRHMCSNCGGTCGRLNRDQIPYDVWVSLADNEDSKGRTPSDPAWTPSS